MTTERRAMWAYARGYSAMTDTDMLETASRALFGADWHRGLARALSVNDSSVRNWMHGRNTVPAGIWDEIEKLLTKRQDEIAVTLAALARYQHETLNRYNTSPRALNALYGPRRGTSGDL